MFKLEQRKELRVSLMQSFSSMFSGSSKSEGFSVCVRAVLHVSFHQNFLILDMSALFTDGSVNLIIERNTDDVAK